MSTEAESEQPKDPFANFREVRTGLRSDLTITRQLTKDEPVYVVHDPVSFQAHRLKLRDYQVVTCLQEHDSLQDAFHRCVAKGYVDQEHEEQFFRFVSNLDALGLLTSSQQDPEQLYKRFQTKQKAANQSKLTNFLFLTIPLSNPDKFLDRTHHYFKPLFTKAALWLWGLGALSFLFMLQARWADFVQPLNSILATKNLIFMAAAFLVLKVWHELGHGYACKIFGGRVPEMGCKLIVGMPLAYVDATSAWSFPDRKHRIMVMLGGMYFESLVAIPSILVWAAMPNSFIGSCAYQLIFMAGLATLLFNANPLMKFDGYFILSDLVGVPNLRKKSVQQFQGFLQRWLLGIRPKASSLSLRERAFLVLFGLASTLYTTLVMISILGIVAYRLQILGLVIGAMKLGGMLVGNLKKLFKFLLASETTAPVRTRARVAAAGVALGIPAILFLIPVPTGIQVQGIVTAQKSTTIRASTPGILTHIGELNNQWVQAGQELARLENLQASANQVVERISSERGLRSALFVSRTDLSESAKLQSEAEFQRRSFELADKRASDLTLRAPHEGKLVFQIPDYSRGLYVQIGDPIAKVVSGKTVVRAYLDEQQVTHGKIQAGTEVHLRFYDNAAKPCKGSIQSVSPAKVEELEDLAVSTASDGEIAIDPSSKKTQKPMFLVKVEVADIDSSESLQDLRAQLLIGRKYEPSGKWFWRTLVNFTNGIFAS